MSTVEDIVSLGMFMGLDMSDNVVEIIEEHNFKIAALVSRDEEEVEKAPTSLIKIILTKWIIAKNFEKHPLNKDQTSRNSIVWNDQTMSHFRNIWNRKQ